MWLLFKCDAETFIASRLYFFFGLLMCDSGDLHLHISKFIYMSVVTLLFTCSVHCNLSSIKNDVFIWKYFENALASAGSDTI